MLAEFGYRGITSGFYGAITQAFRQAEPPWAAGAVTAVLLPLLSHSIELALHLIRGTPRILTSIISSVCFTVLSTTFNLYAMRRGALVVCPGACSLAADFRRIPRLLAGFIAAGPLALYRRVHGRHKVDAQLYRTKFTAGSANADVSRPAPRYWRG